MENFATKDLEDLIVEMKQFKLREEAKMKEKIGLAKQFARENIEGVNKSILIVEEALTKLKQMI